MAFKVLTQEEAISQGYIHCTKDNEEVGALIKISEIEEGVLYHIVQNEPVPYSIPDDLIYELLEEYLINQEDVADEDCELVDIAASVDYTDITHKLNEVFKKKSYYYHTPFYLRKHSNSVVKRDTV